MTEPLGISKVPSDQMKVRFLMTPKLRSWRVSQILSLSLNVMTSRLHVWIVKSYSVLLR